MHIPVRTLGAFDKSRSFFYVDVAVTLPAIKFGVSSAEAELNGVGKAIFNVFDYLEERFSFIGQNAFGDVHHHRPFLFVYPANTFPHQV